MSTTQIILLTLYACGMSTGQVLFKLASGNAATEIGLLRSAWTVLLSPYFVAAMALYVSLCVSWVWLLTFTPLSQAYMFTAASFIAVPILSHFFFGEAVTLQVLLGGAFIIAGVVVIAS